MRGFFDHIAYVLFFFIFLQSSNLLAQSGKGSPIIQNYFPKLYKEVSNSSQNWSFVQDKRGIMYIGNTEGLIEYDGTRWRIIYTSNNSVIRSLDTDQNGRIYVGGSGDFGYVSYNAKGASYFVSLSMLLKPRERDFTDVWATYATKGGVYFVTNNKIFKYKDRKIKLIYSTSRISAFKAYDRIFIINKSSSGIYRIDRDRFELMPNTQGIKAVALSEFTGNKLLGISPDNSFFTYDLQNMSNPKSTDAVKHFETELSKIYGSAQTAFFQIKRNNNNQFVVNTLYNGVQIIDALGRIVCSVNKEVGLSSNNVYNFYIDPDNKLWLALDKGFANLDLNAPTTLFNEQNGLSGSSISLINFKNKIFIGTDNGVFQINSSKVGNGEIQSISNTTKTTTWDFASFMGGLFMANSNGLYLIDQTSALKVAEASNLYTLSTHSNFKNFLFAGSETNLFAFKAEKDIKTNKIKISKTTSVVENTNPIRSISCDKEGGIWASSNFKGIYYVQINDSMRPKSVFLADTSNGLNALNGNRIFNIKGEIFVSSNNSLYAAKQPTTQSRFWFVKNQALTSEINKIGIPISQLFTDKKNKIWIFSEKMGFGEISNQSNGLEWDILRFASIPSYEINKYVVDNDIIWGLSNNSVYRIDLAAIRKNHTRFNALVRSVRLPKDSILFNGDHSLVAKSADGYEIVATLKQLENKIKTIDYSYNSLIFDFASTFYTNENQVQYSYKLEGFDNKWSDWTFAASKEFSRLFEGRYTLHLKAKNIYGQISDEAVYSFRILSPWYRSLWAYVLYLLLLVFILYRAYSFLTEKFRLDKARLESLIQERTAQISLKNIELLKSTSEVIEQKEKLELQSKKYEEISKEHEKLSIVASKTENAVLIMDAKGDFEWVNESYERMFGYTLNDLTTLISTNIIGTKTPEYVRQAVQNCMTKKISVNYEFSTLSRNGEKLWVQVTLTPILDEEGKIHKIIAVDTDITKTKNTELELIKRSEEIRSQISLFDTQKKYIENLQFRFESLKSFSQLIYNITDFNAITEETRKFLTTIFDTSFFGIGLYNKPREVIEFSRFIENGLVLPYFSNSIHQKNSFSAWCLRNKKDLFVGDIENQFKSYLEEEPEFETISKPKSLIYSPLLVKGEIYGVIAVHSSEVSAYTNEDLKILSITASLISSSVTNLSNLKQIKGLENSIKESLEHGRGAFNLMLPEKGTLDRFYKSFIIQRPKDVIPGDFYWFSRIQSNDMLLKTIVAVGDCTGHDSTGAFIAMVTMYLLNEIVDKRKIYQPSRILDVIDEKLINYLSVQADDVEICLCLFEQTAEGGTLLTFAGAKRPLFVFKSSDNEIISIKGTRRPLGDKKSNNLIAFKSETIVLNSGDLVYLATDGMNNQTNLTSQKFSTETFCKVLKDNAYRPLQEQKERIEYSFDFFKGVEKQRDDIVVVGIKV